MFALSRCFGVVVKVGVSVFTILCYDTFSVTVQLRNLNYMGIEMEIRISVRQLVEFILRSGSIDNRRSGGADTAMQEGSRIHRMIQRRMGSEYHAEISLKHIWSTENYDVVIEGRADGIIDENFNEIENCSDEIAEEKLNEITTARRVVIDEIKGTYKDLKRIKEPVSVHLSQAKCYAYIYALQCRLNEIGVRMTYCNIETEEIKYFHENYTFAELKEWFEALMQEYKKWTDFEFEWKNIRQESIKKLQFPFPYREGQKELVTYVYSTIYHKRKLFLEAPTGVGKTISTVFPAIKAMGEGITEKIFYLTAKTITRTVAQDCFSMLCDNGLRMKTVVITARDKICFLKEQGAECNPDACPYADGHFDRINAAMYEMLVNEEHFSREKILEYAGKHRVCPFEMCLDMSLFSDAVICDYNYVFDPRVFLKRFFADTVAKRDYVFLIDETHNLLERGREMYSASLTKESFLKVKNILKEIAPKVSRQLEKCNKELLVLKRECADYQKLEGIDSFVNVLNRAYASIDDFLDDTEGVHKSFEGRDEVLELYFEIAHFLNMYEIMDENYVIYSQLISQGEFMVKLFCVDPSKNLKQCMQKGRSTILFSATLLPIQYYKKLLGGEDEDYEVYAKSTFDENKKALYIAGDVTSRYTRRGTLEYKRIAKYIHSIVSERYGNYMVFFPSHQFLEDVYNCFIEEYYDSEIMECVVQSDYMSEESREQFLKKFTGNTECDLQEKIEYDIEQEEDILIGFCVLGGIFSEGIDLKNDSLIGAIIVGTGIPQIGAERELLKNYFNEHGKNGYDYAYRYPGMNKVLQSAGRVIRTAQDIGVVALLDERFLELQYRRMFPREWSQFETVNIDNISKKVEKFWNEWL